MIQLSKGWGFTLGVFLGYRVARAHDQLPFVMRVLSDIREATSGRWLEDAHDVLADDEDEDD